MELKELLPFLLPLILVQFGLLIYALHHVFTHSTYKRGSRKVWVAVCIIGMEFVGPVLYFILGKEDA